MLYVYVNRARKLFAISVSLDEIADRSLKNIRDGTVRSVIAEQFISIYLVRTPRLFSLRYINTKALW